MSLTWGVLAIVGLAVLTLATRAFFLVSDKDHQLPEWLMRSLRYAPLAALSAVVVPDLLLLEGRLITSWRDPRLFGAAAGLVWYVWQRGILGTIVCGMAVFLLLRLGLGW